MTIYIYPEYHSDRILDVRLTSGIITGLYRLLREISDEDVRAFDSLADDFASYLTKKYEEIEELVKDLGIKKIFSECEKSDVRLREIARKYDVELIDIDRGCREAEDFGNHYRSELERLQRELETLELSRPDFFERLEYLRREHESFMNRMRKKISELSKKREECWASKLENEGESQVLVIVGASHAPSLFEMLRQRGVDARLLGFEDL